MLSPQYMAKQSRWDQDGFTFMLLNVSFLTQPRCFPTFKMFFFDVGKRIG